MLNEFYEFIAKKVNSFFQKAASDGTLLKGESFCLKLDNDDMVAKVSSALKHLAEENKIIGIYELVCRDNSVYKTYTLKVKNDEVIIAAQIDGMTNDFLCATLRNAANSMQKSLLMISSNPIDSAKSGSRDMAANGMPFYSEQLMVEITEKVEIAFLSFISQKNPIAVLNWLLRFITRWRDFISRTGICSSNWYD